MEAAPGDADTDTTAGYSKGLVLLIGVSRFAMLKFSSRFSGIIHVNLEKRQRVIVNRAEGLDVTSPSAV